MIPVDTSVWIEFLRDMGSPVCARVVLVTTVPTEHEEAAALPRSCRRRGRTVRRTIDCLIGSIALRMDDQVLHPDAYFEVLARHTSLQVHR